MDVLGRNNVVVSGRPDGRPMVFAHGFGCDQQMWRHVAPAFEDDFRVVLFDHVGNGGSDSSAYTSMKYSTLHGYAQDINQICEALDLRDVVLVGHSVSATIGMLAVIDQPERYASLVMVGPSPRYIDDPPYVGGFSTSDIDELLESMDSNYLGWSSAMGPLIMGNGDRPALGDELTESFPYRPELVGQPAPVLVLGKGSGLDSVAAGLDRLGRTATPEQMQQILDEVKARSLGTKSLLDDDAFASIVDDVTS